MAQTLTRAPRDDLTWLWALWRYDEPAVRSRGNLRKLLSAVIPISHNWDTPARYAASNQIAWGC